MYEPCREPGEVPIEEVEDLLDRIADWNAAIGKMSSRQLGGLLAQISRRLWDGDLKVGVVDLPTEYRE